MKQRFQLKDLQFELPQEFMQGKVGEALLAGRYEMGEANALLAHLRPGDRFLDMGAGIGYLCALAARVLGPAAVTGVEAAPDTYAHARANLNLNGFAAVRLLQGAVLGGEIDPEVELLGVEFGVRPAFWASGLRAGSDWPENAKVMRVPALSGSALLSDLKPTVLSCDIEGGELAVLTEELPKSLRLILAEVHPAVYGREGVRAIFEGLMRQGFVYEPRGSRGQVVVFARG